MQGTWAGVNKESQHPGRTKLCDTEQKKRNKVLPDFIIDTMSHMRSLTKKLIIELSNFVMSWILAMLLQRGIFIWKINLTCDGWVSLSKEPYITITCHFIDNEWKRLNFVLDFFFFPHPHDFYNISESIIEVNQILIKFFHLKYLFSNQQRL